MAHVLLTDNDVQVAGLETFPANGWREAILAFVAGLASGTISRPKINFGCLTLRLSGDGYFAYGMGRDLIHPFPTRPSAQIKTSDDRQEIESGMRRFAEDKRIKQLHIKLHTGSIVFWKKAGDEYGCWTDQVPESWGGLDGN